jgi:hypothetical protein
MFFQKIGKSKQRHNLTIKLHKLACSDVSKLRGGKHFKIIVTRYMQV